jgi:hypothetical protein
VPECAVILRGKGVSGPRPSHLHSGSPDNTSGVSLGWVSTVINGFGLRGGSHDGERHRTSPAPPEYLFGITTQDGERFARTGEVVTDTAGVASAVYRFDPQGEATAEASRHFGGR